MYSDVQQKHDILNIKYIPSALGGFPLRPDSLMQVQVQVQVMKYAQHQQSLLDNAALDIFTRILQQDDHPCDLRTL